MIKISLICGASGAAALGWTKRTNRGADTATNRPLDSLLYSGKRGACQALSL